MEEIERQRRYKLHGAIISAGWPSIASFARDAGYSTEYIYMVVKGSLHPPRALQHKLCEKLNLSVRELKELL
jgi:hypothetical protein